MWFILSLLIFILSSLYSRRAPGYEKRITLTNAGVHGAGIREGHASFLEVSGNPQNSPCSVSRWWWRRRGWFFLLNYLAGAVTHNSPATSPHPSTFGVGATSAGQPNVHLLQPWWCRWLLTSRLTPPGEGSPRPRRHSRGLCNWFLNYIYWHTAVLALILEIPWFTSEFAFFSSGNLSLLIVISIANWSRSSLVSYLKTLHHSPIISWSNFDISSCRTMRRGQDQL